LSGRRAALGPSPAGHRRPRRAPARSVAARRAAGGSAARSGPRAAAVARRRCATGRPRPGRRTGAPVPGADRRAAPREVGDGAVVPTVDAMCMTLARGTACGPAGDEAPAGDPLLGNGALGATQPFELGQERGKASDYAKTAATAAKQESRAPPANSRPERSSKVGKTRLPSSRPISELQVAGSQVAGSC
jgi:hypothetical protein